MVLSHLYTHTPLVFGHRGASSYAPENTLAAFRLALQQGAEGIELDVTLSADGEIVVIHDDTVDRTTDGHGEVARLTLAQLRQFDAGYPAKFGTQFAGERIPTLEEVFAAVSPAAIVNVELKVDPSPDQSLAARVAALIQRRDLRRRVIISSFHYENLQRLHAVDPELPLGLLYDPSEPWKVARAWLNPGVPAQAHHPYFHMVQGWSRAWYRARGRRVNVWTVDQEADLLKQMRLGVDGIITDCPDVALRLRNGAKP